MRGLLVLDQVGLMLAPGELVGLIGPNAAGKTTLVRTLAGLRQPDDGTVLFDGTPIADLPRQILARRLAYLPQAAVCHWPLTVERLVGPGRLPPTNPWPRSGPGDQRAIDATMDEADIRDRKSTRLNSSH